MPSNAIHCLNDANWPMVRSSLACLRNLAITTALVIGAALAPAAARDHDEARQAVEAGEIRPLSDIMSLVRDKFPGEIVRVRLKRERGRWVYEFRIVALGGRLLEIHVDARNGDIERVRER